MILLTPEVHQRSNMKWYNWDGKDWTGPFETQEEASAPREISLT